jgi:hypothetical protein
MIDFKNPAHQRLRRNVQGYKYFVFQTITTAPEPLGKRHFYNLVHHSALAYDVRG